MPRRLGLKSLELNPATILARQEAEQTLDRLAERHPQPVVKGPHVFISSCFTTASAPKRKCYLALASSPQGGPQEHGPSRGRAGSKGRGWKLRLGLPGGAETWSSSSDSQKLAGIQREGAVSLSSSAACRTTYQAL